MRFRNRIIPNPFFEAGKILQDFSVSGDKTKAKRQCHIMQINFSRFNKQDAFVFAQIKKIMSSHRQGR